MLITYPYSHIHSLRWNSIICTQYDVNPNKNYTMVPKVKVLSISITNSAPDTKFRDIRDKTEGV